MTSDLNQDLPEQIKVLLDSGFDFHLTGSRFFKNDTESSDWDFFVEYSSSVVSWLTQNGFTRYPGELLASDQGIHDIYRRGEGNQMIDVQVVTDSSVRRVAQQLLLKHGFDKIKFQTKEQKCFIWATVVDALFIRIEE